MSRYIYLRLAIPVLIAAIALPLTAHGQSQDSQTESIADAARRAREQKKAAAKPSHVVTDDNLKPASIAAPEANSPATAPGQSSEAAPKPTSESEPRPPRGFFQCSCSGSIHSRPGSSARNSRGCPKKGKRHCGIDRLE